MSRFSGAERNYALAAYLRPLLQEGDGLYIWGSDATLYNLTETLPAGGKYIVNFHVRDFDAYDSVMAELRQSRPQYVVVLPEDMPFDDLSVWLTQYYVETYEADGAVVYRLI